MIGWIDGSAGASGDMLLGALVGVGVPLDVLQAHLGALELGIVLRSDAVERGGLAATKVDVEAPAATTAPRRLADVLTVLEPLDEPVGELATHVFRRLAAAEAAVHAVRPEDVHFHEVGALDSIADIVGVCAGLVHLGLDELHCSTLSLGNGTARSAHGPIPIPAPAVIQLLTGVAPVQSGPAPFESTTPTGAALLASTVTTWGPMPAMTITATGGGAGSKESDVIVNATRLIIGDDIEAPSTGTAIQIDANVDDLDPRVWPTAIAAAIDAGAHDAWVAPITMKKGRPAHTFSALCGHDVAAAVRASIFRETSTIGVRETVVRRHMLERAESFVVVDGESLRVKTAVHGGNVVNRSVEWDDVVAAARRLDRSTKDLLAAATAAIDRHDCD